MEILPAFGSGCATVGACSGILGGYRWRSTRINSSTPKQRSPESPQVLGIEILARSHPGRVRPNNGIAVLADGMGGLNAGEVASQHAVDLMLQGLTAGLPMEQAAIDANRVIYELSRDDPELYGMGTTLVALSCADQALWLANVGDSRIYRYREGRLEQLTRDHSVVQQLVDSGELSAAEARVAPNRNIITRALGIEATVQVDVLQEAMQQDDLYMLCSDGVTDMLAPEELATLFVTHQEQVSRVPASTPAACADLLDAIVQAANDAGGVDNISVVLVRVVAQVRP